MILIIIIVTVTLWKHLQIQIQTETRFQTIQSRFMMNFNSFENIKYLYLDMSQCILRTTILSHVKMQSNELFTRRIQ